MRGMNRWKVLLLLLEMEGMRARQWDVASHCLHEFPLIQAGTGA